MTEAQVRHRCADLEQEKQIAEKNYERLQMQLSKLGKLEMENARLKEQLRTVRDGLLQKYDFELSIFNNPAEQVIEYHLAWKMNNYEIAFFGQYSKLLNALSDAIREAVIEDFATNVFKQKENIRIRRIKIK